MGDLQHPRDHRHSQTRLIYVLSYRAFITHLFACSEGQAYLEKNAKAEGVTVLPSGLQYKVLVSWTQQWRYTCRET